MDAGVLVVALVSGSKPVALAFMSVRRGEGLVPISLGMGRVIAIAVWLWSCRLFGRVGCGGVGCGGRRCCLAVGKVKVVILD